ncbi:MAG: phosphoserine transaminase [Alphaproteobacteria bacterium]|nr:phosphoserine transaminase [Alphaproteobacteria bacterium]
MTDRQLKPDKVPARIFFSSGPCAKRPGWSPAVLSDACLGQSHRAAPAKAKLQAVLDLSRDILGIPDDYRIAIVPASDTGAVEMALWSLLGVRGIDVLVWESFGAGWVTDIQKQLRLDDVRVLNADYGALPDLGAVDFARDVVFTWNGTTSGVCVPDGDWIDPDRQGLTICDATSAAFAMDLAWDRLDVTTWSWQKAMGGEAQHGMLVLSPRAVSRLESYTPPWPLPKLFRLTKAGKLNEAVFAAATINTPSMLCVEDQLDALTWAESIGGLGGLMERSKANLQAIADWVADSDWADFLAKDTNTRSSTSVCLAITDPWFQGLDGQAQAKTAKALAHLLADEKAALDIGAYRDAPPGLRIWAGATVERRDIEALLPWLDWAYGQVRRRAQQ